MFVNRIISYDELVDCAPVGNTDIASNRIQLPCFGDRSLFDVAIIAMSAIRDEYTAFGQTTTPMQLQICKKK